VCVCVCVCVCLSGYALPNFSSYLLQEHSTSHDTFHGLYICYVHATRACVCMQSARACVHSLIYERILSKFAGNILRLNISGNDYVLFIFTHRVSESERD
jgi:hypothetical protein